MRKKRYIPKYYKKKHYVIHPVLLVGVLAGAALLFFFTGYSLLNAPEDGLPVSNVPAASVVESETVSAQDQTGSADTLPPSVPESENSQLETEDQVLTPEEQKYLDVLRLAEVNCTNAQPSVTDPACWQQQAVEILEGLEKDSYYQNLGLDLSYVDSYPYLLAVNRAASTVTVYGVDDQNRYTVPYMAMVCSGGEDTPLGYYHTPVNYQWRLLSGPCYGQYATRIWDAYLFHSVPYYTQHKDDLEYIEFNKLGTLASLGCIRLQTVDVKWIYDHCPIGTKVIIYDDEDVPGPMGKPGTIWIDPENVELRGWDPTDPDPENPWDEQYRSGTAIRSDEAWEQYQEEQAVDAFQSSITPTDLQGWNHDYLTEGTRG